MNLTLNLWDENSDRTRARILVAHSFLITEEDLDRLPSIAAEAAEILKLKLRGETLQEANSAMLPGLEERRRTNAFRIAIDEHLPEEEDE